jgi:hypothetical protein
MLPADGFAMGASGSGCIAQAFANAIHAMAERGCRVTSLSIDV